MQVLRPSLLFPTLQCDPTLCQRTLRGLIPKQFKALAAVLPIPLPID
jgi:hypothetical protein